MARTCPSCGSRDTAKVVYGMPDPTTMEAADRGDIVLGGCCLTLDEDSGPQPELQCRACGAGFSRPRRGRPALA